MPISIAGVPTIGFPDIGSSAATSEADTKNLDLDISADYSKEMSFRSMRGIMSENVLLKIRIPHRDQDIETEIFDGEVVFFSPEADKVIHLNASASVIWALCDGQRDVQTIVSEIRRLYSDAGPGLENEILGILETFVIQGFLRLL